ncbi:DnaJ family domain-containing protein [Streptomyces sp. 900116325]
MTERKPAGVSFESWVDKQIREAEQRGDFSQLPGFGKPLPGIDRPYDETWWIKAKMQREGVSMLPPALALRKEAEDTRAAVSEARSEAEVRRMLTEVNEKIEAAIRRPPPGPLLNVRPFDIDAVVEEWRAERSPA